MAATSSGGHEGGSQNNTNKVKRFYCRENTITVDVLDNGQVKPDNFIKFVHEHCGVRSMFACVPRSGNLYEITLDGRAPIQYLLEGIKIGDKIFQCREIVQNSVMVSFLHLPAYIEDQEIEDTLASMKVEILSPIKRRYYPGTNIADGTRYVKVKLPPNMPSFPYTIKFRKEYYRVIHNGQMKVCSLCYSSDHLFRECPKFVCFRCKKQGHYARACTVKWCHDCLEWGDECSCGLSDHESDADDRPSEEVNKEDDREIRDEEAQERESEIEITETQGNESVQEERGQTNEGDTREELETCSNVKENVDNANEPSSIAGAASDHEKQEQVENEAMDAKSESSESSEPDDEIIVKGKTKRKKKVKKGKAKKNR